jgi:hypothetical protein
MVSLVVLVAVVRYGEVVVMYNLLKQVLLEHQIKVLLVVKVKQTLKLKKELALVAVVLEQ